jgi:hypothetical protein
LTNPPAFHSILAIAATHIDALFGKRPGQRAIWHRVEAIRMVNQQLGGAIIDIPQALMTIANLMTIEVSVWTKYFPPFIGELAMTALENQMLWGDPVVAEMHAKGLATICIGQEDFSNSKDICAWNFVYTSGLYLNDWYFRADSF